MYGGGISEGNTHSKVNLPTLVAGKANGRLKPGRYIQYEAGTPMANLFMTLLDTMNVRQESNRRQYGQIATLD